MKTIVLMADAKEEGAKPSAPLAPQAEPKTGTLETPPPAPLLWSPFRGTLGGPTETLILLIVILFLGVTLFGWAFFFRRRSRHSALGGRSSGVLYEGGEQRGSGRRRRRSRHPEELPRNPTLKERGGLPPAREDGPGGAAPASPR
ncbi:MAG TPA: hypothetical protein DCM86_00095 [Verrucomicrobiales bacterium]|nr:hypothetical protein [Verrucomicrobiales bacterium]